MQDVEAVLVGGQAVNVWAELFSSAVPELEEYGPFTSKDIDFFGPRQAALALAKAISGEIAYPTLDDHTPNTAIVTAISGGYSVSIDFLSHVLGTGPNGVRAVEVQVLVQSPNETDADNFKLKLMHPIHCLFSRVNTILHPAVLRRDGFAIRQVNASFHILRKYIDDCLATGAKADRRDAFLCFDMLCNFLLRDGHGRRCHTETPVDPLQILKGFTTDERIDPRYRTKTLAGMITRIEQRRAAQIH